MKINNIVIVSNGEFKNSSSLIKLLNEADIIIAADGGCNWLNNNNIVPHYLIGDMDSILPEILNKMKELECKIIQFPVEKNETDTELAIIKAFEMNAKKITIIGALGLRIDHAIANISLLSLKSDFEQNIRIFDGYSYIYLIKSSIHLKGNIGDLISLIPISGNAEGIHTTGLKYSLNRECLFASRSRGISNVLIENNAFISLKKGLLMVVHNISKY